MFASQFFADERGAVTIDFAVVTAAIAGLGVATLGAVSAGVSDLSGGISSFLSSDAWNMYNNGMIDLGSFDFTNGDSLGWVGGAVMDMGGELGELLVLGPSEAASFLVDVPEGADQAVMQFDLIGGDSLDNSAKWGTDNALISLNGVNIASVLSTGGSMTFDIMQTDGTTVDATVSVAEQSLGGKTYWGDSVAAVTVTVDQPSAPINFQVQSNANQSIGDEFWGVDNFSASSTGAAGF